MQKIESMSPQQWAEVERLKRDWLDNASRQPLKSDVELAIEKLYALKDLPNPFIVHTDSPLTAILFTQLVKDRGDSLRDSLRVSLSDSLGVSLRGSLRDSLSDSLSDSLGVSLCDSLDDSLWDSLRDSLRVSLSDSLGVSLRGSLRDSLSDSLSDSLDDSLWDSLSDSLDDSLWFYWQQSYCAFIEGGKIAGVKYDESKLSDYQLICKNLSFMLPYKEICIVAAPPIYCEWSDNGEINSVDRAAVEYADGFKIYAIEGYRVPEQVVLNPSSQTIEEINNEDNEEIKRIRIERYSWDKYLTESNASVVDFWTSPNGYLESLMKCGDYKILCTYDPSTGRPYSLEVNEDCNTCEDAQEYLLAPEIALAGLGIKLKSIYPTVRT